GAGTGCGRHDRVTVMVGAVGAFVCGAGLIASAVPDGFELGCEVVVTTNLRPSSVAVAVSTFCPRTSGISICLGPLDTTRSTPLALSAIRPARGSWEMTLPFGTVSLARCVTFPTLRPAFTSVHLAPCTVRPSTWGTRTCGVVPTIDL